MSIRLVIPGIDLVDHFQTRSDYHKRKADAYREQAVGVRSLEKPESYMSGDPTSSLERSAAEHDGKAAYFKLLAQYVDVTVEHEVTPSEIAQLELAEKFI